MKIIFDNFKKQNKTQNIKNKNRKALKEPKRIKYHNSYYLYQLKIILKNYFILNFI